MMRWVKVEDIGDTEFLPEEVVDKFKFRAENLKVLEGGGRFPRAPAWSITARSGSRART